MRNGVAAVTGRRASRSAHPEPRAKPEQGAEAGHSVYHGSEHLRPNLRGTRRPVMLRASAPPARPTVAVQRAAEAPTAAAYVARTPVVAALSAPVVR